MLLDPVQYLLGALSGSLVGLSLGLFGGGGSILAVPLMVYVVGVPAPHVAVGTSAFAVAANAAGNLLAHARRGNVIWRCAFIYSAAGILGAFVGSGLGKALDGEKLLFLFALLMGVVGVLMFRSRRNPGTPGATCNREKAPKVLAYGAAITSLGLALATWIPRMDRAIGLTAGLYVVVLVGAVVFGMAVFGEGPASVGPGVAAASPFWGVGFTSAMIGGMVGPGRRFGTQSGWLAFWIVAYGLVASGLLLATLKTFNRCLGRIDDSLRPAGPIPRPARGPAPGPDPSAPGR